jgi:hypothetical protein
MSLHGPLGIRPREEEDDETLRDRLDAALAEAEDTGKAVRTLDAMLGEPQTLIPIDAFGDVLYAIIKEDTVVTVLPQGHGEEILQRGQAMEQRVAAGHAAVRPPEREDDRWDPRRRWRKEAAKPVVIERIVRGNGNGNGNGNGSNGTSIGSPVHTEAELGEDEDAALVTPSTSSAPIPVPTPVSPATVRVAKVVAMPERESAEGPVSRALQEALTSGRRKAAVAALVETLGDQTRDAALLPLWNEIADQGVVCDLTIGDLLDAVRTASV